MLRSWESAEGDDSLLVMTSLASSPLLRSVPAVVAGALAVAVGAQLSVPVPGSPVPQSLQTLAVVVVGGVLGWGRGVAALVLYLALGASGLPVFAEGAAGVERLWGPTAGYLWGFVVGAGVAGLWRVRERAGERGWAVGVGWVVAGFVVAHGVILALGWGRLAFLTGAGEAWSQGVAPFLWGGVVKSLVGALGVVVWLRWRGGAPG